MSSTSTPSHSAFLEKYSEPQRQSILHAAVAIKTAFIDPKFPVPINVLEAASPNKSTIWALEQLANDSIIVKEDLNGTWTVENSQIIEAIVNDTSLTKETLLSFENWVHETFMQEVFSCEDWLNPEPIVKWLVASGLPFLANSKAHWHSTMTNYLFDGRVMKWFRANSSMTWTVTRSMMTMAVNEKDNDALMELEMLERIWLRKVPVTEHLARALPLKDGAFKRMLVENRDAYQQSMSMFELTVLWVSSGIRVLSGQCYHPVFLIPLRNGDAVLLTGDKQQKWSLLTGLSNRAARIDGATLSSPLPCAIDEWTPWGGNWVLGKVADAEKAYLLLHPPTGRMVSIGGDPLCTCDPVFCTLDDGTVVIVILRSRGDGWYLDLSTHAPQTSSTLLTPLKSVVVSSAFAEAAKDYEVQLVISQAGVYAVTAGCQSVSLELGPVRQSMMVKLISPSCTPLENNDRDISKQLGNDVLYVGGESMVWLFTGSQASLHDLRSLRLAMTRVEHVNESLKARRLLASPPDDQDLLLIACKADSASTVKQALNDNAVTDVETTAEYIHTAASMGWHEVLQVLVDELPPETLESAITIPVSDDSHFHVACQSGSPETISLLLRVAHPSSDAVGEGLVAACRAGFYSSAMILLGEGSTLSSLHQEQAVLEAIGSHDVGFVVALLEAFNLKSEKQKMAGKPFIPRAVEVESLPILKLLVDAGADPRATNEALETGLHVACRRGLRKHVRRLLPISDPLMVDSKGKTALAVAHEQGHQDLVGMLVMGSQTAGSPSAK